MNMLPHVRVKSIALWEKTKYISLIELLSSSHFLFSFLLTSSPWFTFTSLSIHSLQSHNLFHQLNWIAFSPYSLKNMCYFHLFHSLTCVSGCFCTLDMTHVLKQLFYPSEHFTWVPACFFSQSLSPHLNDWWNDILDSTLSFTPFHGLPALKLLRSLSLSLAVEMLIIWEEIRSTEWEDRKLVHRTLNDSCLLRWKVTTSDL